MKVGKANSASKRHGIVYSILACIVDKFNIINYHDIVGAFGKVFRGTLKTSLPGQGSNGTAQRDVAVKTLKSEFSWYDFVWII